MNNILIGIKRFLKNRNTVTIFMMVVAIGVLYWGYNYRIQKATEPVSVPYALNQIGPRTEITSDMVGIKKVPGGIVNENVYSSKANIVGKFVKNTVVIPKGSIFYQSSIAKWEELPSSIYSDIPNGNTIVALSVSLDSTFGNSIFPGNYIDLYYYGSDKNNNPILGKFIESIEVLDVTDSSGNSVFETAGDPLSPSYLIFSVDEDMHLLLRKATATGGNIFPVQRNASYSEKPSATRVANSTIQGLIIDKTKDVQLDNSHPTYKTPNGLHEVITNKAESNRQSNIKIEIQDVLQNDELGGGN